MRLWDVADGQEKQQFHTESTVSGAAFPPTAPWRRLPVGTGTLRFWSVASGQLVRDFQYAEPITGIDLAPGGKRMILTTPSGR